MRKPVLFFTFLGLMICTSSAYADLPPYVDYGMLMDGPMVLKVANDPVPTTADWNNDGAKDVITGQYTQGYIRLYLNQGTDLNPLFNGFTYIESNGVPITNTSG